MLSSLTQDSVTPVTAAVYEQPSPHDDWLPGVNGQDGHPPGGAPALHSGSFVSPSQADAAAQLGVAPAPASPDSDGRERERERERGDRGDDDDGDGGDGDER